MLLKFETNKSGYQAEESDAKNLFEVLLLSQDERFHQWTEGLKCDEK